MRVTLWGTRGSIAAPGPETVRYGGNTSCVSVEAASDGGIVVLDGGTGLRRLGTRLSGDGRRVDILLTHLHMDHIQGLGFFRPFYEAGREIHIWGPPSTTLHLRARLSRYLSPPLFPVRLRDLPCRLELHDVPAESFRVGPLEIEGALVCHPGATVGYRIREKKRTVAYLPDHEPALGARNFPGDGRWTSGFALAERAELLIHDSQYLPVEYDRHVGWGHSTIEHAAAFAKLTGAGRFVTFHHDPGHSDEQLDLAIAAARNVSSEVELLPGMEGSVFEV